MLQQRYYWGDFLADMRAALIRSEADVRKKLSAQKPDVEVGIWIEQITTLDALLAANGAPEAAAPAAPQVDTTRYGRMARYRGVAALPQPARHRIKPSCKPPTTCSPWSAARSA